MNIGSRRYALRTGTSQAHSELDGMVGELNSRTAYERYLAGIAAFRVPLEIALTHIAWPSQFAGWKPALIGDEIRADLDDLGLHMRSVTSAGVPETFSGLVGTAYVLEGSALGARLLYKNAQALGFDADCGARHLARQAADLTSWRTLLDLLELAEPFDMYEATEAATATFEAARRAFATNVAESYSGSKRHVDA